jgi:hypothetical protein
MKLEFICWLLQESPVDFKKTSKSSSLNDQETANNPFPVSAGPGNVPNKLDKKEMRHVAVKYLIQIFFAHFYFDSLENSRFKTAVKSQLEAFPGNVSNPAFPMAADLMAADRFANTIQPVVIAGMHLAFRRFRAASRLAVMPPTNCPRQRRKQCWRACFS